MAPSCLPLLLDRSWRGLAAAAAGAQTVSDDQRCNAAGQVLGSSAGSS